MIPTKSTEQNLADHGIDVQKQLDGLERHFVDLQRQIQRLQKFAAMGTMSAILAHEFNNLITPVIAYSEYALRANDAALMQSALDKTLKHARRAADLCRRILGMACDDQMGPVPTRLRPLVVDAVECLARDLEKDCIDVSIDVDDAMSARIHAASIQQVLFNLILNARQAMLGRRGRLVIRAECGSDDRILLHIADNGPGIKADVIEEIFEPFYTTKSRHDRPDRRGLGLGLTISRQLAEENGGTLTVQSRYGHGATFTLALPAAE